MPIRFVHFYTKLTLIIIYTYLTSIKIPFRTFYYATLKTNAQKINDIKNKLGSNFVMLELVSVLFYLFMPFSKKRYFNIKLAKACKGKYLFTA